MGKDLDGTPVNVIVTPLIRDGQDMVCSIEPGDHASRAYVQGGVINLQPSGEYALTFELADGQFPELEFDAAGPFWCSSNACPKSAMGNPHFPDPHVKPGNNKHAHVGAVPGGGRQPYHYSLNFSDGSCCDPIIINS